MLLPCPSVVLLHKLQSFRKKSAPPWSFQGLQGSLCSGTGRSSSFSELGARRAHFSQFFSSLLAAVQFSPSSICYHRGSTSADDGLTCVGQWGCCGTGWNRLEPAVSGVRQPWPLLTEILADAWARAPDTPSIKCISFLQNCLSALSCRCL